MSHQHVIAAASAVALLVVTVAWRKRRSAWHVAAHSRKRRFLAAHPDYGYPAACEPIDHWRPRELPGLLPPVGGAQTRDDAMVYLDYAGAALPLASQLARAAQLGSSSVVLANPHSTGPAAAAAAAAIERARRCVLQHFCGEQHAHEWELIWTSGSTAALRIAAETFPFSRGSLFAYTMNAHTSVLGMRVPAAAAGAHCRCVPLEALEALVGLSDARVAGDAATISASLWPPSHGLATSSTGTGTGTGTGTNTVDGEAAAAPPSEPSAARGVDHLIVLPAECNLTGDRPACRALPTRLLEHAHSRHARDHPELGCAAATETNGAGGRGGGAAGGAAGDGTGTPSGGGGGSGGDEDRYWVLLDVAKVAATAPVHLPSTGAAMACVSLYKLFGEPTGLGALLVRSDLRPLLCMQALTTAPDLPPCMQVRSDLAARLRREGAGYFGGGSVASVLAAQNEHTPKPTAAAALVQGTAHFRGALAVPAGFEALRQLGGMRAIAAHTAALTTELVQRLNELRHADGSPAIVLYGRHVAGVSGARRLADAPNGPTVAFNVRRQSGEVVGYAEVTKLAALHVPPIQMRGGCCCNPGGCQRALGLTDDQVRAAAASGKQCGDAMDSFEGHPTGVVRASLGKDSLWEDVDALLTFLHATFVAPAPPSPARSPSTRAAAAPTLRAIYVYPIKSCAAMCVPRWWMHRRSGKLLYDREWALVDGGGRVMRLEAYPRLALLQPHLELDARRHAVRLTLRMGRQPPLVLPLDAAPLGADGAPTRSALNVCGKDCAAADCGGAQAARWLSEALQVQCRLVRHCAATPWPSERPTAASGDASRGREPTAAAAQAALVQHPQQPSEPMGAASRVAFANEAPLLVLAHSAVDALNASLRAAGHSPVSARHFRPNLVLDGAELHATLEPPLEAGADGADDGTPPADHAEGGSGLPTGRGRPPDIVLSGGEMALRVTSPCARCAMVEIDPTSGVKHGAVLRALAQHHRVRSRLHFGVFCAPQGLAQGASDAEESELPLVHLVQGAAVTLRAPS